MSSLRPTLTRDDAAIITQFRGMVRLADVANLLEVPHGYLKRILSIRQDRSAYTRFQIPKRNGGFRSIDAPPKALRILQQKLNYILQLVHRPKPAVHGFVRERSILTNAIPHVNRRWVLNLDLENFFPSIHLGRVRGALMSSPFHLPSAVATALAQLCTRTDGVLPQGAPTSPFISNIVCARLDGHLMALAKRYRLTYTRYCDDITLSSRQADFPKTIAEPATGFVGAAVTIGDGLSQIVESNGFKINTAKTRLQLQGSHQEVTGITVNQFANVSRDYIRSLRGILHAWGRYGRANAAQEFSRRTGRKVASIEELEAHFASVIRGRVEYVGFVRGRRDPIYCRLRERLHSLDASLIAAAPVPERFKTTPPTASGDKWVRMYDRWRAAVGLVEVTRKDGSRSMGTAFATGSTELLTAAHNLKDSVELIANPPKPIVSARFHARGRAEIDAALVNIDHGLPAVQVDRRTAIVGESIAIVGFASVPMRQPTLGIYTGTVEAISANYSSSTQFYQVSVQSSGGLSGSPMFDSRGRVLGLVVESTFEATRVGVPNREFFTVLPIQYALETRESPGPVPID